MSLTTVLLIIISVFIALDKVQQLPKKNALECRSIDPKTTGLIICFDNVSQFISNVFEETCNSLGAEHERIPTKTPNKNAHIEVFTIYYGMMI